jgi:phosphoribosylglycinamide formyltransferase-1
VDVSAVEMAGGIPKGQLGGVVAGEAPEQGLQRAGAAEALQIPHQGQGAIGLAGPAHAQTLRQPHLQQHRLPFPGKALEIATPEGMVAKGFEACRQGVGIAQHRWQDGQVGHGRMPALNDPSDCGLAIQWPIAQTAAAETPPATRVRLGVMASGSGSNFEAVVAACQAGQLPAEVALLVVNNPGCGASARAERLGIPWQLLDHRSFATREALDAALIGAFRTTGVDLVVMAGWMRIVTPSLIGAFPQRLLNIHPSLLPSFRGLDAVGQALAAGVTLAGCTAHLVSEEVDAGQILAQAAVPVHAGDDTASLTARIHAQEHRILPLAVELAARRLGLLPPQG